MELEQQQQHRQQQQQQQKGLQQNEGTWFPCPGCDRVVTSLVLGTGSRNHHLYSRSHCCLECERGEGGHHPDWGCAGIPSACFRRAVLPGVGQPAHYLLHVPEVSAHVGNATQASVLAAQGQGREEGAEDALPVVLFLHGGVTYVYPETLWWDLHELVAKNAIARECFVIIAPFASAGEPLPIVSTTRTKVDRFGNTVAYVDDFDEDRLWAPFLGACPALGPRRRVDWSRLSVVGYSMGGQSAWNLIVRRGSRLAAAVPFAGCCAWRRDAWDFAAAILQELKRLPIRSYNGEHDTGTFAWRDFMWLARHRAQSHEPERERQQHGNLELIVHNWGDNLQLCLVRGTESCHCCWDPVLHNENWFGVFSWLQQQRCATPLLLPFTAAPAAQLLCEAAFPASR